MDICYPTKYIYIYIYIDTYIDMDINQWEKHMHNQNIHIAYPIRNNFPFSFWLLHGIKLGNPLSPTHSHAIWDQPQKPVRFKSQHAGIAKNGTTSLFYSIFLTTWFFLSNLSFSARIKLMVQRLYPVNGFAKEQHPGGWMTPHGWRDLSFKSQCK